MIYTLWWQMKLWYRSLVMYPCLSFTAGCVVNVGVQCIFLRKKDYAITAIGSYIFELSVCNQAAWFTHVNKYMFQYWARFVSGLYEINLGLIYIQITLIGLSGIRWYLCIYNPSTMNQNSRHGKSTSEWWDYLTSHRYHRKKIHQPLSPRDRLQL